MSVSASKSKVSSEGCGLSGGLTALCTRAAREVLDPLLTAIFPATCGSCGAPLAHPLSGPLCEPCWAAIVRHHDPVCGCGLPLPGSLPGPCGRCRRGRTPFAEGVSLGPYGGALRAAIHELKYHGRRRVAARLAEELWSVGRVREMLVPPAVLVPVPLHAKRERQRGFNQAEQIARRLARRAGLRVVSRALIRNRDTATQTGLSAAARRRNVAGAFSVKSPRQLRDTPVILVDDVYTTGATTRACAHVLRLAGAPGVRVLTVARVV